MTDTTYIKVLSLCEGVEADMSLLFAPFIVNPAVSHYNPLLYPGVNMQGNVLRFAHHKVELDSAAQIYRSHIVSRRSYRCYTRVDILAQIQTCRLQEAQCL